MVKICSNAKFGPVFPTHLACMQSVGSFTNTSRLSFSSLASPGLPSSFRIAFSAQMVCCSVHCAEPLCTPQTQNKHILYTDTHTHTHARTHARTHTHTHARDFQVTCNLRTALTIRLHRQSEAHRKNQTRHTASSKTWAQQQ